MRLIIPFFLAFGFALSAQEQTQLITGIIRDEISHEKLFGASIQVIDSDPLIATVSNIDGYFELNNVPVGRVDLVIRYIGYEEKVIHQLLVESGKSIHLTIDLSEQINNVNEVVIKGIKPKDESVLSIQNEMATVSAMSYSIEQSNRYAGSNNDPSRLVLSFPGVRNQGDIQNGVTIRGNTPTFLLWNLEGLEIQSPNHFARDGALGAVNMMSANTMESVDFYTGAFPAQYGNALSGVFDIHYRKGNQQKLAGSFSLGTLGLEASLEGPLSKQKKGSFLVSYRYSTLGILSKLGYDLGTNAGPVYQDFNYVFHLPTKKYGDFKLFGLLGDSYIRPITIEIYKDGDWSDEYRLTATGLKHDITINKTALTNSLMYSRSKGLFTNKWQNPRYTSDDPLSSIVEYKGYNEHFEAFPIIDQRLQWDVKTNTKVNAKHSFTSGFNITYLLYFQNFEEYLLRYRLKKEELVLKKVDYNNTEANIRTAQVKAFMQHRIRFNNTTTFTAGIHFIHLNYNKFFSIEPRLGLEKKYGLGHQFTLGAGLHSRLEPLGYYGTDGFYYKSIEHSNNNYFVEAYGIPNQFLQASRGIHFVLGNQFRIAKNLNAKIETYCQYLYDIPVLKQSYSLLDYASINFQYPSIYSYDFSYQLEYINAGKGLNYGVDFSLEKAFHRQYYFLINASWYQSKYRTPDTKSFFDKKWISTRYNGNFIFTTTAGKDFTIGKKKNNLFSINTRLIWAGNNREFNQDFNLEPPFKNRLANYFRLDARIAYTKNKKKYSWVLSLDTQNTTNRINVSSNPQINSTGLIPFLNYRVNW